KMFLDSLKQVAENAALSAQIRADAYIQLCYAYIDAFGTGSDLVESMRCLKEARDLGSAVAASVFRPLMVATEHVFDEPLKRDLRPWLVKAVENGSLLARRDLLLLDKNSLTIRRAEEQTRLLMGARMPNDKGVADAEYIEMMFLPANLEVLRMLLGSGQFPINGNLLSMPSFMSRSMNTYLHAGAALGIDPDHFRDAMSVVDAQTIDSQDSAGNTALILALRFGNVENAQTLLKHGASGSLANKRGETPWHWLISLEENDIPNIAKAMVVYVDGLSSLALARNSESNQFSIAHGGTPLHWAVDMRMYGMVATLLDCGADPLSEYYGMTSIDLAIQLNQVEILHLLLCVSAMDGIDTLPLRSLNDVMNMQGAGRANPIVESQEQEDSLVLQAAGIRPLHERLIYCEQDWINSTIQTIRHLKDGQIPAWSEENNTVRLETFRHLSFATTSGPKMMGQLLEATSIFPNPDEGDEDLDEETAATFWKAALKDTLATSLPDMVHFAIDKVRGYSPSSCIDGAETLLHSYCASLHADVSVLQSILEDCSDINCSDELGRTPLMTAVRERNFEIATYLLERGADVNRTWIQGGDRVYILYEYVVNNTDIDVVPLQYLLEPMHPLTDKTPPLSLGPDTKDTVLHMACRDGNPVIVDYLLSKFSSKDLLSQAGEGGMTALHHAVFNGHVDVAMRLCQAGADVNARSGFSTMMNRKRSTPLDLCFRHTTQSNETLTNKFGLERTSEDVLIGRYHIANFLVRRYRARRADKFLIRRSLALRLSLLAAQEGMTKLLTLVLRTVKTEMNVNSHGHVDYSLIFNNLLWLAAPPGHVDTTRLLLGLGADANYRSRKGLSLLHIVSWMGKAEMVYVLTKNGGADIDAKDGKGQSVAWYSARSQDLATIRMVKSLGGYFTVPRQVLGNIFGTQDFPLDLNPQFVVSFTGEPSDDDNTEEDSDANEIDDDGSDQEENEGDDGDGEP
ncbi:hypothetical protein ACHAPJ_013617, partial [Fusarium lateritium]